MNSNLFQQQTITDIPVFADSAFQYDAADLKMQIQHAQEILKDFIMPLTYDGSEAVHNAVQLFLTKLLHDISAQTAGQMDVVLMQDTPYRLLETLYFYYKRAQTDNMKIRGALQEILVKQLGISDLEIQQAIDNYDRVTRFMVGKNHLPLVVKDELIESTFWPCVGGEAHVMLRLLEAKSIFQRRGFGMWHKQLVAADSSGYQQEIEQIMMKISIIRLNRALSRAERKKQILDVIHQYQSQDIEATASNLDRLLVEAERHVKDYFL
jgi:hypothetical protein